MDYVPSGRVTSCLRTLPPARLREVDGRIRAEVRRREMFFHFKRDVKRFIPMALKPWVVTTAQVRYLHRVAWAAQTASLRVWPAWCERKELQELLPLTPTERQWMRAAYGGRWKRPETLMARADLAGHLGRADWRESLRLLEINLVGIGAAYYCYSAGCIAGDVLAPLVGNRAGAPDDLLEMIVGQCLDHGAAIGRPNPTVAMIEYRRANEGPFEYETMSRLYRERGYRVVVADPIELEVRRGEITFHGERIDILYRDPTLADLVWMDGEGDDLRAVKLALKRNQVVSSLGGEMDHKALLELFSSRRYERLFAPAERAVLRRHVPWTRAMRAARVDGPDGRDVDLAEHVRRNRESLLLKPNREYGGKGIQIGQSMTASAWDTAIEDAVRHPMRYVVQERIPFNRDDYPILSNGRVRWEDRYIVLGVHATPRGTAILGRMSVEPVVNITRGGAIVGVLTSPGRV